MLLQNQNQQLDRSEETSQQEIQQVRELWYNDAIIDFFFGGLSFDEFSLED